MTDNYVVYHLHTDLSLLDSCTKYNLYIRKAKELGQRAICFTEHGNIFNWVEKKMYCESTQYRVDFNDGRKSKYFDDKKKMLAFQEKNPDVNIKELLPIKFIHGVECYLTQELYNIDNKKVRDNYHTILIAKNYAGFQEINTLIDLSTQDTHFYYKPRITFEEFFNISDNVIKISACLASPLHRLVMNEEVDNELADKLLNSYDYYEIQPHINSEEQKKYNKFLVKMSKKYNKPLIAGTDTHSLNQYKAECRSIYQKANKIQFDTEDEFDLTYKTYKELCEMFRVQNSVEEADYLQAIENTNIMAASVEEFVLDTSFKYPALYDDEEKVLKKAIDDGYKNKIKKGAIQPSPIYKHNVKEEMRVFKKIGMVGFMLFMSELVRWCWNNGIPVGFCRGSVGGSTVAYLTDIIDVNPVVWNTVFSRFANEDRKEIGDIDIDVAPSQRHLVYEYIINRFGVDKTAYVLAIGTIAEKGTIDEIGRGLDLPISMVNTIKKEYEVDAELTKKKYPNVFYYFDGLLETAKSQSMHPAGIIVSPVTLTDNYGTFWNDGKRILSINMEEIHEVSLVKYDILGLKNIEIIKDACELAGIPYPKSYEINWEDRNVWNHIVDSPVGVFQFEGKYAFDLLKKFKPQKINDLSLVNASLRPSGESYRNRLIAREPNHNPSKLIDDLLADNNGYLVYQCDVIKFLQQICGLSGSDADNVRRAIGRKQTERLQEALPDILHGYCSKSQHPKEIAEKEAMEFLKIIEDASSYMFGYNHSTGYSMIGYLCGYLRYYYPVEFTTAYLNNANNEDIKAGTILAKKLNIMISPIKFRHSLARYSCNVKSRIIYKGIESINFLSKKVANELFQLKDKKYDSFIDLLIDIKTTTVNNKQLEILIKLDFFSEFGDMNKLIQQNLIFNELYGKERISKEKVSQLNLKKDFVKQYAKKGTEKTYLNVDMLNLLYKLSDNVLYHRATLFEKISYEYDFYGYPQTIDNSMDKTIYFVTNIRVTKAIVYITLFEIFSGATREVKIWMNQYTRNQFEKKSILKIISLSKKHKKEATGEKDIQTGKIIYVDIPDKYEYWLEKYTIIE